MSESENDVTALDRWRWWVSTLDTTQDEELDCDAAFDLLEKAVEAVQSGNNLTELYPAFALHVDHCLGCKDLFETLLALARSNMT